MLTILGQIIDFVEVSEESDNDRFRIRQREASAIVIGDGGRIEWVGVEQDKPIPYRNSPTMDFGNQLILPGFVDAHLHYPQYRMLAAPGRDLLDWLTRFTFPEEVAYGDPTIAARAATFFLDQLFRNGTTSCLVFSTTHATSVNELFLMAERFDMALATGKTWMDREAPRGLLEASDVSYRESKQLIDEWHGRGRLHYALAPRFAVTSSPEQLEAMGALLREHPELLLQTHLSENEGEIRFVAGSFPEAIDYTDVYDRYGFLRRGSLFAHGIHLSERELSRLSETESAIIHCPTSNGFLGSGQFRWKHTQNKSRPVAIGLGCDIGAGTSYSMLQTMREAFVVSQLLHKPVGHIELFYTSTLGNARILGWENELGSIEPGKFADLVVWNPEATEILAARNALSHSVSDQLFALMILGDDRAIVETFVAGKPRKKPTDPR